MEKYVADIIWRAEGPCANTWAQGNPGGSGSIKVIDPIAWAVFAKPQVGEYFEAHMNSDYGPRGDVHERPDIGHHFEGSCGFILRKYRIGSTWPPAPQDILIEGLGWLTYNLQYTGVADEVQLDCPTPDMGPAFKLVTPIFDYSVPIQQWPWLTQHVPGSTYSFPRTQLWIVGSF